MRIFRKAHYLIFQRRIHLQVTGHGGIPVDIAAEADACLTRLRAAIAAKLDGLRVRVEAAAGGAQGVLTRVAGRLQVLCEGERGRGSQNQCSCVAEAQWSVAGRASSGMGKSHAPPVLSTPRSAVTAVVAALGRRAARPPRLRRSRQGQGRRRRRRRGRRRRAAPAGRGVRGGRQKGRWEGGGE